MHKQFFGRIISNVPVTIDVPDGICLHLSNAVAESASEHHHHHQQQHRESVLMTNADDGDDLILCVLSDGAARQFSLNIYFDKNVKLWSTGYKIHVSGYRQYVTSSSSSSPRKRKTIEDEETQDNKVEEDTLGIVGGQRLSERKLPWMEHIYGSVVKAVKPVSKTSGMSITDYVIGNGNVPKLGSTIRILYQGCFIDGTVFDNRLSVDAPLVFRKGTGQVVKGLDSGLDGMKVGGQREIFVPAELG